MIRQQKTRRDRTFDRLAIEAHLHYVADMLCGYERRQVMAWTQLAHFACDTPAVNHNLKIATTGGRSVDCEMKEIVTSSHDNVLSKLTGCASMLLSMRDGIPRTETKSGSPTLHMKGASSIEAPCRHTSM